jgi:hypothetical protein
MPADSIARKTTDHSLLSARYDEDPNPGGLARSAGYRPLTAALSIREASQTPDNRIVAAAKRTGCGVGGRSSHHSRNARRQHRACLGISRAVEDAQEKTKRQFLDKWVKAVNEQQRLKIVSDSGYWALDSGKVSANEMAYRFPGTVVSIEIDTADKRSYRLSSEISEDDIF